MRSADILNLALSALWQQKVRTLLTTLGVVFGAFVLAASLSIGQGVQETLERESYRHNFLRRIDVWPNWQNTNPVPDEEEKVTGEMTDARRQRLQQALLNYKQQRSARKTRVLLTQDRLKKLAALEHVESVLPHLWQSGFALLEKQSQKVDIVPGRLDDHFSRQRIIAGRYFETSTERSAVVSEFVLYRMGIVDDQSLNAVVGKKLRVELRGSDGKASLVVHLHKPNGEVTREETVVLDKIRQQLPTALDTLKLDEIEKLILQKAIKDNPGAVQTYAEEFTIAGVVRVLTAEDRKTWDVLRADGDVILPVQTATNLFFQIPNNIEEGVRQTVVIVDREENVKEVLEQITQMGLQAHAALEHIERERLLYLLIFGAMTSIAAVALLVAALGIANTMLMSVLERTREIGVMKAVGASNNHLQLIFVVEGALIGFLGGGVGLLLALGASYPADAWVRSMVSRDLKIELTESIFVFPLWLVLATLFFAVMVTTLAAVYPARRAAKVDPVRALRHE